MFGRHKVDPPEKSWPGDYEVLVWAANNFNPSHHPNNPGELWPTQACTADNAIAVIARWVIKLQESQQ
jgi:hypothetical protein